MPPESLNCLLRICFDDGAHAIPGPVIYADFVSLRATCDGDVEPSSGGTVTDPNYSITVSAMLNPDYKPPSDGKRKRDAVSESQRTHARSWGELERRDDGVVRPTCMLLSNDWLIAEWLIDACVLQCTDGHGDYMVIDTFKNSEKDGDMRPVTGRLPAGSSYMIAETDSMSIMVSTSVSVEAGFFDLFSASASVSVGADYSVSTTTGVTVKVDCDDGQDGIIYLAPTYTRYFGECTSDNYNPITVYVPGSTQNNYFVQCLGS